MPRDKKLQAQIHKSKVLADEISLRLAEKEEVMGIEDPGFL